MAARFDLVWAELTPHLDPILTPPAHRDWMRRFLSFVPQGACDFLGFEARLGGANGPTDCALNLNAAAIGWLMGGNVPAGAEWDRIYAFLQLWNDTAELPGRDLTRVWLEFDQAAAPALLPNLMFGYWPQRHERARTRHWLLDRAIPAALGAPLPPATRALLERGLDASAVADDFQIGLMSARALPAVRLCVFDLPPAALPDLVAAIGWPGDVGRLADLAAAFRPHADFVGLHFDLAGQALPRVGIEPGFVASSWQRQPHLEPRWSGQFDALQAAGALTDAKRAALLGWPGHDRIIADGRPAALLRGLSHVKLVLGGDGMTEGKAYYGIALRSLAQHAGEVPDAAAA
jgi:hypothetical protein